MGYGKKKAVIKGKYVIIRAYFKQLERHQINALTMLLKDLEKQEQTKPQISIRREILKIGKEMNKIIVISRYKRTVK